MSDDPDGREDLGDRSDRANRGGRDEPLADLAAEVRERTGDRPASERPEAPQREGPLADVAAAVDERRRKGGDGADAFESVEVGELDGEKLWEQLAEGGDDGSAIAAQSETATVQPEATAPQSGAVASAGPADATAETGDDSGVRTIPKDTCHGCPHFGDPPELACTHEGTAILAMPDSDHFRVSDCPMVVDGEEDIGGIGVESDDADETTDDDGPLGLDE